MKTLWDIVVMFFVTAANPVTLTLAAIALILQALRWWLPISRRWPLGFGIAAVAVAIVAFVLLAVLWRLQ